MYKQIRSNGLSSLAHQEFCIPPNFASALHLFWPPSMMNTEEREEEEELFAMKQRDAFTKSCFSH